MMIVKNQLETVAVKFVMSLNRIYLSVFNYGAIELGINHIRSLINSGMDNYIAYVTDKESYDKLTELNYNVYQMSVSNIGTDGMDFGTRKFEQLGFVRYRAIAELLEYGNEVWYMDVDTVVLQNLNNINIESQYDIVFQNDLNMVCTGCMLVRPTGKSLRFMEMMVQSSFNSNTNDQIQLNMILKGSGPVRYSCLSHFNFPNGVLYFDVNVPDQLKSVRQAFEASKEPVYFVHANWMIGINTKIQALKIKNLWYEN